jgi:hypothetical protein
LRQRLAFRQRGRLRATPLRDAHSVGHLSRARVALRGVLRKRLCQHRPQLLGQPLGGRAVERRRLVDVLEQGRERRIALERDATREDLERDDPERVQVAAMVDLGGLRLLGAHVVRRPDDVARSGRALHVLVLGDAEVHQPRDAVAVQHDVGRLQVAVDDAGVVDGLERVGDLDRDVEGLCCGQRSSFLHQPLQVHAVDELHRDEEQPLLLAEVVDRADVAMSHAPRQLDLGLEALRHPAVVGDVRAQHLDRDDLVERAVARLVDHAHAAAPERTEDLVARMEQRARPQVD